MMPGEWDWLLKGGSPINKAKMAGFDPSIMRAMPDPRTMQVPEMGVVPGNIKQPSIWDKIQSGLLPMPEGAEGLLSEADMKGARSQGLMSVAASLLSDSGPKTAENYVGTGQAIGKAIQAGQGAGQAALGNKAAVMQMQAAKAGLETKQMELEKMKTVDAGRKAIIAKYPPKGQGNTRMREWIDTVYGPFVELGDEETVAKLTQIRSTIGSQEKEPGDWVTVPGPDGKPMRRHVTASEAGAGIPEYEKPTRDNTASMLDEQRLFSRMNMLGDDYRAITKSIATAADQYRTMHAVAGDAKHGGANGKGSPQAQIALVFSYMKTLDPTSVVRESEYATAANAAGVPERVRNQYNKILSGAFLTPEQVDGFLRTGRTSAQAWKRQQDRHRQTYDGRARNWKINPSDVTQDYFADLDLEDDKDPKPKPKASAAATADSMGLGKK